MPVYSSGTFDYSENVARRFRCQYFDVMIINAQYALLFNWPSKGKSYQLKYLHIKLQFSI